MIIGSVLTEQHVYNGIYNAMRLKLVELGHLPNKAMHQSKASYDAAIEALRQAGAKIIEVRNVNSGLSRQEMKINTFYINSIGRDNGTYGGGKAVLEEYLVNSVRKFKRVFQPAKPVDINIEVSYKTESIEYDQLMRTILINVLGERTYLASYANDGTAGDSFLLMYNGEVNMDSGKMLDKRARYTAKDLILTPPKTLQDNIPEATTITPVIGENEVLNQFPNE